MKKPERNEPCHCGSGKKYKKCCLAADEANELLQSSTEFVDNEEETEDDFENEPFESESIRTNSISEKLRSVKSGIPFPDITDEEDAFLDEWYKQIEGIEDPLELMKAAEKFMNEHPELVPAWGFEGEYLLDLKHDCVKKGYVDEIYQFLWSLRKRFPGIYQREFGYYDSELIFHSLAKNRISDIPLLLDNFEQYPEVFPDEMFKTINILAIKGKSELLFPLLIKIHKKVMYSNEILGGDIILTPLLLYIESKYISGANTDDSQYANLCEEIKSTIEVELEDKYFDVNYWKEQHAIYFSEPGIFSCNLNKKEERKAAYITFLKQFQRYLYETITKDWVTAALIVFELLDYISYTLKNQKAKKHKYFVLENSVLDKYIAQQLNNFIWIDTYHTNALLNGVWYFSEFLVNTGNATTEEMNTIRNGCMELHATEQKINYGDIESLIFNEFPM